MKVVTIYFDMTYLFDSSLEDDFYPEKIDYNKSFENILLAIKKYISGKFLDYNVIVLPSDYYGFQYYFIVYESEDASAQNGIMDNLIHHYIEDVFNCMKDEWLVLLPSEDMEASLLNDYSKAVYEAYLEVLKGNKVYTYYSTNDDDFLWSESSDLKYPDNLISEITLNYLDLDKFPARYILENENEILGYIQTKVTYEMIREAYE